jgi:hypothetical protein
MISGQECYAIWAPDGNVWSPWAKPVVFASVPELPTDPPLVVPVLDAPGVPEAWGADAIVLDLPGDEAVAAGLACADRGFRPVPLFNGTDGPNPVVAMQGLVSALGAGSQLLKAMSVNADAKPVFLLDANRRAPTGAVTAGRFDNRWVVLPQDMPSGTFLLSQGITRVTLIQRGRSAPLEDLSHVLLRWQQAGLTLRAIDVSARTVVEPLIVSEPSLFRKAWYAAIAIMGLRRSNVGGFGSTVPEQTTHSGYYG